jgi:hypothetical protein
VTGRVSDGLVMRIYTSPGKDMMHHPFGRLPTQSASVLGEKVLWSLTSSRLSSVNETDTLLFDHRILWGCIEGARDRAGIFDSCTHNVRRCEMNAKPCTTTILQRT